MAEERGTAKPHESAQQQVAVYIEGRKEKVAWKKSCKEILDNMQCVGLKGKPGWQQLQNNHYAKLSTLQMARIREQSACLHDCVVLLADLYRNVWPGNVLRAIISKGHLQEAPQPTWAVYILHCLQSTNACVIPTHKSHSERRHWFAAAG